MRTGTVSYKLEDLKKGVIIPIGFVGENDFTRVIFDAEEIYKKFPNASVSMKVQPPKGGIYPATVTRDGNTVIWQVKEADVANRGGGELQLTFTDGETKIKTYIAKTDVKRSLAGNGPAPDPVQDWIDDAEEVLEEVEAAEINQPTIGQDGYWYTWNQETGEYVKSDTKAQGADGAPGQDGAPGRDGTDATPTLVCPAYADLTFPVTKDTLCYKDGTLYKAKQDISTSESWTAAHWDATNIDTELRLQKNDIQGLDEQINGEEAPEVYVLPNGYKDANYSNKTGTLMYKYDNGVLMLRKANGSDGAITTSNAGLTIDSSLMFDLKTNPTSKMKIEYDNGCPANVAYLAIRFYDGNVYSNSSTDWFIPVGSGEMEVDLTKVAEDAGIDITTKFNVMIREIGSKAGAQSYGENTVTVYGFRTSGGKTNGLADDVSDLQTAVEEIDNAIDEIADRIDDLKECRNLYANRYEDLGYIDTTTGDLYLYNGTNVEKTSTFIPVVPGDILNLQAWANGDPHGRIGYYDAQKAFISYEDIPSAKRTSSYAHHIVTIPSGAAFARFGYYSFNNGKVLVTKNAIESEWKPAQEDVGSHVFNIADEYSVIGVAHMGRKNLAPENTPQSFILALQNGYTFVETDVRFTSDGVPVLLHDATINRVARNADGTAITGDVYIKDIKYAEALDYDFGVAFDQSYAGTKIMRFVDFIILCKSIGLNPFIEIKNDDNVYTETMMQTLVDIVDTYRMNNRCTWQSYQLNVLVWVKKYRPESRIMLTAIPLTEKRIIEVQFLKTAFNETVINIDLSAEDVETVKPFKIPAHIFATESDYDDIDQYVTSVISDGQNYAEYILNKITGNN